MKVYKNACDCSYCKGGMPEFIIQDMPRTLVAGIAPMPYDKWNKKGKDAVRYAYSGGRHPYCIVLGEDEDAFVIHKKKYIQKENEIVNFPASVHSCWKLKHNHILVIIRKL